ncbi:uncharacterized protein LOC127735735 [Mytilus californianus]|uniref:uncharacterized protein LOC127735735 n=1 Tax=Mytilus californianus TaxID=6549 RepID=UPI0022456DDF|nr:uncharacterized protein LOC127735735 [Mytilus californianus]
MEKIISKYDYANGNDDTESALQDELNDLDTDEIEEKIKISDIKNIINIYIKKICLEEYVKKVPRDAPGCYMATATCRQLCDLIDNGVENEKLSKTDCQDCLFDLYLAIIRAGPGTAHYEVLEKIGDCIEMDNYLKNLKGEKLQQMASAVMEHKYIKENMEMEDYASLMNSYMSRIPQTFADDREDIRDPAIWTVFLDLYLYYLLHTKDVPDELHEALGYCGNTFWYLYDRNPYKGFPNTKVTGQHMQKIAAFILSPEFPRGNQLERATDYVEYLAQIEGDTLAELWPDMMALFKALSLCKKANEMSKMIRGFRYLFDKLDDKAMQKNPRIFQSWAETVTEVVEKIEHFRLLDDVVPRMISDMDSKYKPAKGDEKYWFPLIKAMWLVPTKEFLYRVRQILDDTKFRRMWNWKENIQEAKDMIANAEKVDLPLEGDDRDERDANSECGNAVKELIEMFKILKIEHLIMPDIARMSLSRMEKRSILQNYMVDQYFGDMDFQKCTDVLPELARRFEPLITDEDYPWLDNWVRSNGVDLFNYFIESYKSSEDIPDEVNQIMIRILSFCMEDGRELINLEDGSDTVWGMIIRNSPSFVSKHCNGDTGKVVIPVLEKLLKYRHSDEEFLREACTNSMQIAGHTCPEICADFFGPLLDWYIEEPSMNLMSFFYRVVELSPNALKSRMDKFLDTCKDDKETWTLQIQVFYALSNKYPEMITQKVADTLMNYHYSDSDNRIQVLMIMEKATKVNPIIFEKYMDKLIGDKSVTAMEQHFVNNTLVNVTKEIKKFKDPVFNYLMSVLKVATDVTQVSVTLIGLRDLCVIYGPEMFGPHMDYLTQKKQNEQSTTIQQQIVALIDQIEGRSLETVAQDVKETQEDVEQLDERVTGAEVAVVGLTTRVDEQEENIEELGEGLDTVTQRVDFAEKDIEETKIKVEEVDMKTMTNAPRWSRDLTKIMNPQTEHDWRLLAQRLGYSKDDIRAWASQHDPCMAVLSEWYATHKTREANYAVLTALQEMNRMDGAAIVENAMKAVADVVEDDEVDYASPPAVFLSYQWGHQDEVKLIRNHLQMAGYECWMDIGQMGGGDKLFEKIDNGIRGAKVIICCVSEKYAQSPNCNREVNLSVSLGKPMIPLLMEKMGWPPKGSMGPIFSEYLFVRFFQRAGEETDDNRIWPVAKFQEMLMQLNCYGILPDETLIDDMYKKWWIPVQEVIVIDKNKKKQSQSQAKQKEIKDEDKKSPDIFISYQWGKQKQIMAFYQRLTGMGLSCWMDIYQMGGGDSLYEKIDSGVRGCKVVLTCITQKYSLSANCRREVSLADALKKPIIPLLLEKMDWPPSGPMSMVFTQLLFINFYRDEEVQMTWTGPKLDELMEKIGEHMPMITQSEHTNEEKQSTKKEDNDKKSGNSEPESKPANQSMSPRPVSSRNTRGAGGPQPTENKPSPVRQPKPVAATNTIAESPTDPAQQRKQEQTSAPKQEKEQKKSKSCTVL